MSTLAEIEDAIRQLPASQVDKLVLWLQKQKPSAPPSRIAPEPDFLARAKKIWGENPPGEKLSDVVIQSRR
jgi:hypothetical protein